MNFVWFLTIATTLSLILGEFGQYPFGKTPSISLTDILLIITLIFLLIWQVGIKKKFAIPNIFGLLMLFWIVGFISLILSQNFNGGLYLLRFILYSSSFWLGYLLVKEKVVKKTHIHKLIILVGIFLSFLGFFQLIIFPDLKTLEIFGYDPHQGRLTSTFLDPNFIGTFLNICLFLAIDTWEKFKKNHWLAVAGILLTAIILTFSRSAYLMLLSEVLLLGLIRGKKIILVGIMILLLSYLFIPRVQDRINGIWKLDVTAMERIRSWEKGLRIFQEKPFFGLGFNNLRETLVNRGLINTHETSAGNAVAGLDSSLIFILATTGIFGFLSYILFWLFLVRQFLKRFLEKKELVYLMSIILVVGLFINSQFINSLFFPPIMFVMFLFFGSVYEESS